MSAASGSRLSSDEGIVSCFRSLYSDKFKTTIDVLAITADVFINFNSLPYGMYNDITLLPSLDQFLIWELYQWLCFTLDIISE